MRRGVKVKRRPQRSIRAHAEEFRRFLGITSPRVDVAAILEHRLRKHGVEYEILPRSEMGADEGRCWPNQLLIQLREDVYDKLVAGDPRARFTLGHEFGHLLMHEGVVLARSTPAFHHWESDSEWQADTFSAEFLMPVNAVRRLCTSDWDVMKVFGVSPQAAQIRIDQLRTEGLL